MREILFKAKRIDNGKWVEGYYCKWLKGERIITYSEKETDCIITWMSNGGMSRYEVDPETICQFTGLHDKHGNKIWENDIVSDGSENRTYKVMYDEENLCLAADNKAFNKPIALITLVKYFSLTVIGSAIDNSELLKGGK